MNKYQTLFEVPYQELKKALDKYILDGQTVMDLGCNNGNLEVEIDNIKNGCTIYAVDFDAKALKELELRKFKTSKVEVINSDINIFLKNDVRKDIDAVVLSATLHEINTPSDQENYLLDLFKNLCGRLNPRGVIIIGDFYYPDNISDEDVKSYMVQQLREIGHADARNKFIKPELIKSVADRTGFSIEYSNEFRAIKEIDRKYVVTVLRKI